MAKDYTKIKHSDLIKYGTFYKEKKKAPEAGQLKTYSKKGKIIESGAPGTLSREHDKAMVRLNKIMSLKRKNLLKNHLNMQAEEELLMDMVEHI